MELKHFLIGVGVFALLGLGLFYLGSLLTSVEGDLKKTDGPPPPIAEIFETVEGVKAQAEEAQRQQEHFMQDNN
jgi:hypothetical protein